MIIKCFNCDKIITPYKTYKLYKKYHCDCKSISINNTLYHSVSIVLENGQSSLEEFIINDWIILSVFQNKLIQCLEVGTFFNQFKKVNKYYKIINYFHLENPIKLSLLNKNEIINLINRVIKSKVIA